MNSPLVSTKKKLNVSLVKNTISNEEIDLLIEWLRKHPRLTKGDLTLEFERKWSEFIGVEYSVFVNSGSSANLLMVYLLLETGMIKREDKVIVPSLSWATSLAPFMQFGLTPILCDCNMDDLSIDIDHFQQLIKEHSPKVLMLVPILGFVPNMDVVMDICKANNIILLEDACESLGSKYNGKQLGSFGLMSAFSTYFGHHISTIEGGMICTNDKKISNVLRALRSHGWDRDMDKDVSADLRSRYAVTDFNDLYTFYYAGFNVRATDVQAFLGIHQLEKLPMIVKNRNLNYNYYKEHLDNRYWKPTDLKNSYVSNFAYPIISKNRDNIVVNLKNNGVECRPLLSGSLAQQPYWFERYGQTPLKNCDIIHDQGMYIPNNHELTEKEIKSVCEIINSTE